MNRQKNQEVHQLESVHQQRLLEVRSALDEERKKAIADLMQQQEATQQTTDALRSDCNVLRATIVELENSHAQHIYSFQKTTDKKLDSLRQQLADSNQLELARRQKTHECEMAEVLEKFKALQQDLERSEARRVRELEEMRIADISALNETIQQYVLRIDNFEDQKKVAVEQAVQEATTKLQNEHYKAADVKRRWRLARALVSKDLEARRKEASHQTIVRKMQTTHEELLKERQSNFEKKVAEITVLLNDSRDLSETHQLKVTELRSENERWRAAARINTQVDSVVAVPSVDKVPASETTSDSEINVAVVLPNVATLHQHLPNNIGNQISRLEKIKALLSEYESKLKPLRSEFEIGQKDKILQLEAKHQEQLKDFQLLRQKSNDRIETYRKEWKDAYQLRWRTYYSAKYHAGLRDVTQIQSNFYADQETVKTTQEYTEQLAKLAAESNVHTQELECIQAHEAQLYDIRNESFDDVYSSKIAVMDRRFQQDIQAYLQAFETDYDTTRKAIRGETSQRAE
jgi:hypothetical protein